MTNKTKLVVKGFSELTNSEKRDFLEKVRELEEVETYSEKRIILEKINLGPVNDGCPCCGK